MLNILQISFLVSISLLSLALAIRFVLQRKNAQPLANRLRDPSPIGLVDVLILFGSWVVAQTVAIGILQGSGIELLQVEGRPKPDMTLPIFVLGGTQLIATLCCLVFYLWRYKKLSSISLQRGHFAKDIQLGFVWFLVIIPPVLWIQIAVSRWVEYEHDTLETLKQAESAMPILATWFGAVLVAPLVEEIFFRGVLQNWLQRLGRTDPETFGQLIFGGYRESGLTDGQQSGLGASERLSTKDNDPSPKFGLGGSPKESGNPFQAPETEDLDVEECKQGDWDETKVYFDSHVRWIPIFVTSVMFSVSHIGQGAAFIPLFFLSIGLGYLYRQTGSIVPGLLVHLLLNFQTMFWVTMSVTT